MYSFTADNWLAEEIELLVIYLISLFRKQSVRFRTFLLLVNQSSFLCLFTIKVMDN